MRIALFGQGALHENFGARSSGQARIHSVPRVLEVHRDGHVARLRMDGWMGNERREVTHRTTQSKVSHTRWFDNICFVHQAKQQHHTSSSSSYAVQPTHNHIPTKNHAPTSAKQTHETAAHARTHARTHHFVNVRENLSPSRFEAYVSACVRACVATHPPTERGYVRTFAPASTFGQQQQHHWEQEREQQASCCTERGPKKEKQHLARPSCSYVCMCLLYLVHSLVGWLQNIVAQRVNMKIDSKASTDVGGWGCTSYR